MKREKQSFQPDFLRKFAIGTIGIAASGMHIPAKGTDNFDILQIPNREPLIDFYEGIAMTAPGIIAHQSALQDGERLAIPDFDS